MASYHHRSIQNQKKQYKRDYGPTVQDNNWSDNNLPDKDCQQLDSDPNVQFRNWAPISDRSSSLGSLKTKAIKPRMSL